MNLQEIKNDLLEIKEKIKQIESLLSESLAQDIKQLLNSEEWPEAVFDFQIVDENLEDEKMDRAESIIDILVTEDLKDKKFLDFGCGEGHMAKYASKEAKLSIGYDLLRSEKSKFNWEVLEDNFLLTTDFEKAKQYGPYDIILIYDVLDHCEDLMESVLEKAKSLLTPEGKIYLRCHPWSGRHGGHLYRKINKAFVHLILRDDELKDLDIQIDNFNNKTIYPLSTYGKVIENAGLKIKESEIERQDVESFFQETPLVKKRIMDLFEIENWSNEDKPGFQLSLCFVDYVLEI